MVNDHFDGRRVAASSKSDLSGNGDHDFADLLV